MKKIFKAMVITLFTISALACGGMKKTTYDTEPNPPISTETSTEG